MIGEFVDRDLETEFFNDYMEGNMRYLRPAALLLGILYMLFLIPDFFLVKTAENFIGIVISRSVFFALVLFLFFRMKKIWNYKCLAYLLTACEVLGGILFLLIFSLYPSPDYLIQAMGAIVVIVSVFLIPNKWINMVAASVFISVAFFVFSARYLPDIKQSTFSAGIVYVLIVFALSAVNAFRSLSSDRKRYAFGKELTYLSSTDKLTGISNRSKWDIELGRWIAYANRYETPLSIIFFDIDDLKSINDMYGHLAGDKVIVEVTDIVRGAIRGCDVFARWGGDEFTLLLPHTDRQQALLLADRLQSVIAGHTFDAIGRVSCSFGLATAQKDESAEALTERADRLLYAAKASGKNQVAK